MEDTIAAISTTLGSGAISIVRLSGNDSVNIVNDIFKGKDLTKVSSHTINYGFIVDGEEQIDEVLVMVMLAPKTYTTENIVEINCHGGIATTNKILELVLQKGARLAEPGEFTKRAFLNGRINLLEAESVSDLITSVSDKQRSVAMNGVNGRLTNIVKKIKDNLLNIIANIEVNIDYPEYDDAIEVTEEYLKNQMLDVKKDLELLLSNAKIGKMIKSGIDIAIVGRPNVGKSSLLNAFLNEDKAIVTEISGTTRDLIEAKTYLNGIELNLIDTAGIRETEDIVEQIGVSKSKKIIDTADLIILVLNNNEDLQIEDKELLQEIEDKPHIIFINKTDLPTKLILNDKSNVIKGNTIDLNGLENLKNKIVEMYNLDKINTKDSTYLSNTRQINLVNEALNEITAAIEDADKLIPVDMLEIHVRNAWEKLGILIGDTYEDELIDKLFKNFCLGK
jgi:tRNA modification GTPase